MKQIKRLTGKDLLRAYELMSLSREFDRYCSRRLEQGLQVPHFHSGVGQEALMVGSVLPLRGDDWLIYTHRGYGHLMAKGVSVEEIALDTYMRQGGTNNGFGGNMHVNRIELGLPGREGVFGTRFGISAGIALSMNLLESDRVVLCTYGEAAGARGQLYESLNMAVLWDLPVVFLAENNGWSVSSRTEWLFPKSRMSRVWRGFEIPVEVIDGNDLEQVYERVRVAAERARAGGGPSVLEGITYRLDPHIWYDDGAYQSGEEIKEWQERDPIKRLRMRLQDLGIGNDVIKGIEDSAVEQVEQAFERADAARPAVWPEEMNASVWSSV